MRFFLSLALCWMLIGCSGGTASSFSKITPGYNKRLLIHSGANAPTRFPWSGPVTPQDVTIDLASPQSTDPFAPFLNPTYISNPGELAGIRGLSQQYLGAFSEIIVEHLGAGLHDTGDGTKNPAYAFLACQPSSHICYPNLYNLLKVYTSMLSPGGTLTYKSNRYSVGDATGDQGRAKIIEMSRIALERLMEWPSYAYLTPDAMLQYLQLYYANLLTPIGFTQVLVSVKVDEDYKKYNPADFPYYYLEIKAQKNATSAVQQTALQGVSQLGSSGGIGSILGGLGSVMPSKSPTGP